MLTETWDHEVNIFGYNTVSKKGRGGGSKLLYKEEFRCDASVASVKDKLML